MTALGACILAAAELDWLSLKDWSKQGGEVQRFEPMMDEDTREQLLASWQAAVRKVLE